MVAMEKDNGVVKEESGDGAEALKLKELGNKEYKCGAYLKAAGLYTKAIKKDPNNHVLYSNRCAALLQLSKISKALADAKMAIKIMPTWGKVSNTKWSILSL